MDIALEAPGTAQQPSRPVRIAALAYVHRNAIDRVDFELLTEALGLDDLLVRRESACP